MVEVRWTDQSIEDINNIATFIAADSEKYASIQVGNFFERAEILNRFPLIGTVVPELGKKSIRELHSGSYRIIYKVISKARIDILTVHHGARLLKNSGAFKKRIK